LQAVSDLTSWLHRSEQRSQSKVKYVMPFSSSPSQGKIKFSHIKPNALPLYLFNTEAATECSSLLSRKQQSGAVNQGLVSLL